MDHAYYVKGTAQDVSCTALKCFAFLVETILSSIKICASLLVHWGIQATLTLDFARPVTMVVQIALKKGVMNALMDIVCSCPLI